MSHQEMKTTLKITKALSDIQRLRILMLLRTGELCVCQVIEVLGLAPSTVSKHLSILSDAELVISRKDGRWAYFKLPQGEALKTVKPLIKWLEGSLTGDATIAKDETKLHIALNCPPARLRENQRRRICVPVA